MTKHQALQLGEALILWSRGTALEARYLLGKDTQWYPFFPESYEKINVEEGIEWRKAVPKKETGDEIAHGRQQPQSESFSTYKSL